MDLYEKYNLTPIINACGKLTRLSNARVLPEAIKEASLSLDYFFDYVELQDMASEKIAAYSGAEAGFVTNCSASGITLSAAACMAGKEIKNIMQLPETTGMKNEIVMQKGHVINFGAPITQMVRLSGARPVEVGNINGTNAALFESSLNEHTAAVLFIVSHHTARFGCIPLDEVVEMAHRKNIPVIVDAAAQTFLIKEILATGADIVVCSGHKYLASTVSGLVCGKREYMTAMRMQNQGIGRTMKVSKEGVFGLMAAMDIMKNVKNEDFYQKIYDRVLKVCHSLENYEGVQTEVVDDPNGNPFCRARIWVDAAKLGKDALTICTMAADLRPSIRLRDHHTDEGYFDVDVVELHDQELVTVIESLKSIFTLDKDLNSSKNQDPKFIWLSKKKD